MGKCRLSNGGELVDAGAVHVGPPLFRPAKDGRGIDLDQILFESPAEKRVQDGHNVRPSRCALVLPALQKCAKIVLREPPEVELGIVLSELPEDPTIRLDGAGGGVTFEPAPVEERIDTPLDSHSGGYSPCSS
jgi:hypothetical protein